MAKASEICCWLLAFTSMLVFPAFSAALRNFYEGLWVHGGRCKDLKHYALCHAGPAERCHGEDGVSFSHPDVYLSTRDGLADPSGGAGLKEEV